jgi:nitroreductase
MTLYETIFVRRSVRQYEVTPMDDATLLEVQTHLDEMAQLPGQSARFKIVGKEKLKGGFAPYAILAFAEHSEIASVNIGYSLQGVDLWLQSKGIGSVWCGMATPLEKDPDYHILLGFGHTSVPMRSGEQDFKRKALHEISDTDTAVVRAVRLAPSAVNFQPWFLTVSDGQVEAKVNVRGVGRVLPGKLWLIDIGIALKHIEVALEHEGKVIRELTTNGSGKRLSVVARYA